MGSATWGCGCECRMVDHGNLSHGGRSSDEELNI